MLDLDALVGEMHGLAESVAGTARQTLATRAKLRDWVTRAARLPGLRNVASDVGKYLALPRSDGNMAVAHPAPPAGDYTVIATDGSQIEPDHHQIAPWYVINAGGAVFRYGAPAGRQRCVLLSHPDLRPPKRHAPPTELLAEEDVQHAAAALPPHVAFDRTLAEIDLAIELLETEADPGRTVLLLDGPLINWRLLGEVRNLDDRQVLLDGFKKLLAVGRERETPIAGFISRSRAVSWVMLLRISLCPGVEQSGKLCDTCAGTLLNPRVTPPPDAHFLPLTHVNDQDVARSVLGEQARGMRTDVLELPSGAWREVAGEQDVVGVFYLDTGTELARVELPQWVWGDPGLLERVHGVTVDQCMLGKGYPVALAEAHERAVVRGADRAAFYTLMERTLRQQGVYANDLSAKAQSKRKPLA